MASATLDPQGIYGTVVAVQANFYRVSFSASYPTDELLCTRRALLKKLEQTVMVGDRVRVEEPDWSGGRGAIGEVMPRHTELSRPPIANADQILLLFSLVQPELDPFQLTKFLLTAEQTHMQVILGLSKADLVDEQTQQSWCDRLQNWGYQAIPISVLTQQGIAQLRLQLRNKLTVLSGPSGVGKSSLINHLDPNLDLRTGAVSARWHQGRHTTRHVELFDLGEGLLADSPGFNQPSLDIAPAELANLFPEIRNGLKGQPCQFGDCLHRDEPHCAIPKNWERREYYLQLLEELIQLHDLSQHQAKAEHRRKFKSGSAGTVNSEPRLEAKKYRRQSRRQRTQQLEDFLEDYYLESHYDEELSQASCSLE